MVVRGGGEKQNAAGAAGDYYIHVHIRGAKQRENKKNEKRTGQKVYHSTHLFIRSSIHPSTHYSSTPLPAS